MNYLFLMIFSFFWINNTLFSEEEYDLWCDRKSMASRSYPLIHSQDDIAQDNYTLQFPEDWILNCALDNAPPLLKGIFTYLQLRNIMRKFGDIEKADCMTIPSYHRFILVGPPGSGKTTLAYAVAQQIGYRHRTVYFAAASFFGQYRNEAGSNISRTLNELTVKGRPVVIIIDELHKLFEHHANDHSDDSQTAAAFWLVLDEIQKHNPNAVIIGTANNVDKLPPEIKSRFAGKIIHIPMPSRDQKIYALKKMLRKDENIVRDESFDTLFLENIIDKMGDCSLRDLRLLVDTAKIIYYAEKCEDGCLEYKNICDRSADIFKDTIALTKKHFQKALEQLKKESLLTKESLFDSEKFTKKLNNWSMVLSIAANVIGLVYCAHCFINYSFIQVDYWCKGILHHA